MKLDKLTFANLVAFIGKLRPEYDIDLFELDQIVDFNIAEPKPGMASTSDVDKLMMLMTEGTRQIEAVKLYRNMTGIGLKEAKDAVERYWMPKGQIMPRDMIGNVEGVTLGDILGKVYE